LLPPSVEVIDIGSAISDHWHYGWHYGWYYRLNWLSGTPERFEGTGGRYFDKGIPKKSCAFPTRTKKFVILGNSVSNSDLLAKLHRNSFPCPPPRAQGNSITACLLVVQFSVIGPTSSTDCADKDRVITSLSPTLVITLEQDCEKVQAKIKLDGTMVKQDHNFFVFS
jgi:hypothetical protein